MDDHFTSNICRSLLKVIHDRAKPQNTVPGLFLDEGKQYFTGKPGKQHG